MANENAKIDDNSRSTLLGVTDDSNAEIRRLVVDSTTGRLKVSATLNGELGKVLISSNDTTKGYLNGKLVAGTNITLTENNDGGDETLTISTSSGGDVTKVGTPADNQIGVWTGDGTIEGTSNLTYDGSNLQLTGDIGSTGTRITKGWFTDLEVTNAIAGSITGNSATVTNATLTTALTVNTGALTLTANADNSSTLTIGSGANSISGSNTGDQDLSGYVTKATFDAHTVLYATTDDTPAALTVNEQTLVGRLTGGNISAVAIGIADNNIVQIDQADVADNDYAKFTANGLEGRSYAETASDLGTSIKALLVDGGANEIDAAELGAGASTDGQVLTSDGAGGAAWEDAAAGGGSDTTFIPATEGYYTGTLGTNASGFGIMSVIALPDDSEKYCQFTCVVPSGKTGVSGIKAYYYGAGVNGNNLSMQYYTGKLDKSTAANTLTADTTGTETIVAGTQTGVGILTLPADSYNSTSTVSAGNLYFVKVTRRGNDADDTYSSSIDLIGVEITWS